MVEYMLNSIHRMATKAMDEKKEGKILDVHFLKYAIHALMRDIYSCRKVFMNFLNWLLDQFLMLE